MPGLVTSGTYGPRTGTSEFGVKRTSFGGGPTSTRTTPPNTLEFTEYGARGYGSIPLVGGGGSQPLYNVGSQAAAIAPAPAPAPLAVSAERDRNLERLVGEAGSFRSSLAAGVDQDAVNALLRQRDIVSGMAKEAGQLRALSSGGPESGVTSQAITDVLQSGGRDLARLNADLAAGGRSAQLSALGAEVGAAGASAGQVNAAQNFALDTWRANQNVLADQARAENERRRTAWEQHMALSNLAYSG